VRRLGIARNTVRAALASDRPPKYERSSRGSLVDAVETDVRKLLANFPRMPATVIAERIGWEYSITTLKDRIRQIRPEYAGLDPADHIIYRPGEIVQCDLWFPSRAPRPATVRILCFRCS
jgi:transposase